MENEKKPSRLGMRVSAIVVAVLLVVCMAVPAFAYEQGTYPDSLPPVPDDDRLWALYDYNIYRYLVDITDVDAFIYRAPASEPSGWYVARYDESGRVTYWQVPIYGLSQGQWVLVKTDDYLSNTGTNSYRTLVSWSNKPYTAQESNGEISIQFADPPPPPPPDLKESVTSGLTTVLDWVGATVSALFSGDLAGLLPLVAIPVAITILIVAIVVIKRSIWGA